jgi:PAS domain S-box-containing protein
MPLRFTLVFAALLVALVFVAATIWEIGWYHLAVDQHEVAPRFASTDLWGPVRTAVLSVVIALVLTGPGLLWLMTEGVRLRYQAALADDIAKSEKYLRQATELAGLGYCIWDTVTDRCLYCSEGYARIHGTTIEDYMARAAAINDTPSFTHPEDREALRAAVRNVRQGNTSKIEYRIITPNREVRHVREVIKPVLSELGTVVQECATIQDITEQKAQERAVKIHADRFREIFDESPVSLWVEDWSEVKAMADQLAARIHTDLSEYLSENPDELARVYDLIKTLDISQETLRIYRAPSKAALQGFEKSQYASPDEFAGFRDTLCGFLSGTFQHQYEAEETAYDKAKIITRTRHVIPPKHREAWSRVLVTIEDITERRKAKEALEENRKILRAVIDTVPTAISVRDRDGGFVLVNKTLADCYDLTTDEAERLWSSGQWSTENDPDAARNAEIERDVQRVFATDQALPFEEKHYDFGTRKESWSVARLPILDASGRTKLVASIAFDITERKGVEEALVTSGMALQDRVRELEDAQDRLEDNGAKLIHLAADLESARDEAQAANRAKSQFLAAMSHELRTPLNAILGFSELIRGEAFGPVGSVRYRDYVEDIHSSGQLLLDLINDVLDLSKIESGEYELNEEAIDIEPLVRAAIRLVQQRAEKGQIELIVDLQEGLPHLWADRRKVTQILVNLLSNAIKFTEAAGRVTLTARCREDSEFVFQVIDTGIGMAPTDVPRALTQFTQVDSNLNRKIEGTGLGLPLTKALAELHGGSLELQSEIGLGTVTTVRFPSHRTADLDPGATGSGSQMKRTSS